MICLGHFSFHQDSVRDFEYIDGIYTYIRPSSFPAGEQPPWSQWQPAQQATKSRNPDHTKTPLLMPRDLNRILHNDGNSALRA